MSAHPENAMKNADSYTMFALALFWERNNVCVTKNGNLVARDENAPHKCETEPPLDELRKQWDKQRVNLAKDDEQLSRDHARVEDGDKITQIGFAKDVPWDSLKGS
jgi:hypothetical protein